MKKTLLLCGAFFFAVAPALAMQKTTCGSKQITVKNLEELIVHSTALAPGTRVSCGSLKKYTIQSDESSDKNRCIVVVRNHGRFCGKATQNMKATITKSFSHSDVHIARQVDTTACGKAIQVAAYATGIVAYTSAIVLACVKMTSHI